MSEARAMAQRTAADTEMLSLLDIDPYSPTEVGYLAKKLLEKMNKEGQSKLTVHEMVMLRLIRTCFEV